MKLYYFFDPLCGWCYGFGDTPSKLENLFPEMELHFVCGGMILGQAQGKIGDNGKYILNVLPRLTSLTGCTFGENYKKKLESGDLFLSSMKPSIAVNIVKSFYPDKTMHFIQQLQKQMFVAGNSLEDDEVYEFLAADLGLGHNDLLPAMKEQTWRDAAQKDFELTASIGIQGFPTLVAEINDKLYLVSHGWASYPKLISALEELLISETA